MPDIPRSGPTKADADGDRLHRLALHLAVSDWRAWADSAEGRAMLNDPAVVASASEDDLAKLLTTIIRSERFGDGTLESAFKRGMLTAIVRRAAQLAG